MTAAELGALLGAILGAGAGWYAARCWHGHTARRQRSDAWAAAWSTGWERFELRDWSGAAAAWRAAQRVLDAGGPR